MGPTELQIHWLPVREAIDKARAELDGLEYAVFLSMLTIRVAAMNAEHLDQELSEEIE